MRLFRGRRCATPASSCTRERTDSSLWESRHAYIQAGLRNGAAIRNDTRIASAWIGDGSTACNDFHSASCWSTVRR